MPTKFLILNIDDAIFTPMIDYIYYKNRGLNPPRIGGRHFNLGAPDQVRRQLLWVAADDQRRPANKLFDQMRAANAGEVVVSATHANVLAGVAAGEQIYICVHGQYRAQTDTATDRILLDCAAANVTCDATWFENFLTGTLGLPAGRAIHLKVFACYSGKGRGDLKALNDAGNYDQAQLSALAQASFAGRLKTILHGTRPLVTVSGYVGATRLPAGQGQSKQAFGVGGGGHKSPASAFRVTFAAGGNAATLPAGWQDWITWL